MSMTRRIPCGVGAAALVLVVCALAYAGTVRITVSAGVSHVFRGLGAGTCNWSMYYNDLPQATRAELASMIWGADGADFRFCRIWAERDGSSTYQSMQQRYGKYTADVKAASDSVTLLFAPWGSPDNTSEATMRPYAAQYAAIIKQFRDNGTVFDVTGICNEPQVESLIPTDKFPAMVRLFREELDKLGLEDVKIIGPEFSNVDAGGFAYMNALIGDAAALDALDGFAVHSYNMAMTKAMHDLLMPHGKELWQTEASANGGEQDLATMLTHASTGAGRMLSDVNLGVTQWMWFVAYDDRRLRDSSDIATHILTYNAGSIPDNERIGILLKYYYLKQLSRTFRPGAKIRMCTSDLGGESRYEYMENTYGMRPAVNACAGLNPDSTWALGVQNLTGNTPTYYNGTAIADFSPAESYDVTFWVEELADAGDIAFNVYRSDGANHYAADGAVTMHDGELAVSAGAMGLVTLRSVNGVEIGRRRGCSGQHDRQRVVAAMTPGGSSRSWTVVYTVDGEAGEAPAATRLTQHDTKGRLVRVLDEGMRAPGTYRIRSDVSGDGGTLSAGAYFLSLSSGGRPSRSARMVVR